MGGMTTFVYAAVGVSGLKLLAMDTLGRRMRLILSLTFAVAVGVGLVPAAVTYNFWPVHPGMSSGMKALRYVGGLTFQCPIPEGSSKRAKGVTLCLHTSPSLCAPAACRTHGTVHPSTDDGALSASVRAD